MISEGGAQAFQSNSAVNGLVQNSCIWKAKPQHLKPTPCFSTDNDGHLRLKNRKKKIFCNKQMLSKISETCKGDFQRQKATILPSIYAESLCNKAVNRINHNELVEQNIFHFCLDSMLHRIWGSIYMSCCIILLNYLAVLTCILLLVFRANGPRR